MMDPSTPQYLRAPVIGHTLWVTKHHDDERWPCGSYPTQSTVDTGMTEWINDDESLENTDVVLWYVFGLHHITRPEEWPIMSVDTISFWLKPFGFFDQNPAIDVAPIAKADGEACHTGTNHAHHEHRGRAPNASTCWPPCPTGGHLIDILSPSRPDRPLLRSGHRDRVSATGQVRTRVAGGTMATLREQITRRKPVKEMSAETGADTDRSELKRTIGLWPLSAIGIGGTIGTGIFFVLSEAVPIAGPAVIWSFVFAGVVAGLTAICYAELAGAVPVSGSSYSYAYATLGELTADGRRRVPAAGVRGLRGRRRRGMVAVPQPVPGQPVRVRDPGCPVQRARAGRLVQPAGRRPGGSVRSPAHPGRERVHHRQRHHGADQDRRPDRVHRHRHHRLELRQPQRLHPLRHQWNHVRRRHHLLLLHRLGRSFDRVVREAKNPRRNLPLAILIALLTVTTLYVLTSLVAVAAQPTEEFIDQEAGLPQILEDITGSEWPGTLIAAGAIISIFSVTLVALYGQTRILFAMSRDGMIPSCSTR